MINATAVSVNIIVAVQHNPGITDFVTVPAGQALEDVGNIA